MRRRKASGVSLVELMIAGALFALTSVMIGLLVRSGHHYLRRMEARADLQRVSLFALSEIAKEVAQSSMDCIRYHSSGEPVGLVYANPLGLDGVVTYVGVQMQWKSWVCVYWDPSTRNLVRVQKEFSSPTLFKPDPSPRGEDRSVSSFQTGPAYRRVLARHVAEFKVEGVREVKLELKTEVGEGDRRSELTTRTSARPHH